ncbi:MAG: hypothetical protein IH956_04080 [Chloroflexi bacterium]|nr:hypothetical protein [Chloroflexota bacterium]
MLRLSPRADSHGNRASSVRARDPHRDCDPGAVAYSRRHIESLTNGLGHRDAHPVSDRFAHPLVNSDTSSHSHPNSDSYPCTDRYANADAHPAGDPDSDASCESNSHARTDSYRYRSTDLYPGAQPSSPAHVHAHTNSDPCAGADSSGFGQPVAAAA